MHYNKDIDAMCFASYNYNDGAFQGRLRRGAEAMQTLPTFCAGGGREHPLGGRKVGREYS